MLVDLFVFLLFIFLRNHDADDDDDHKTTTTTKNGTGETLAYSEKCAHLTNRRTLVLVLVRNIGVQSDPHLHQRSRRYSEVLGR